MSEWADRSSWPLCLSMFNVLFSEMVIISFLPLCVRIETDWSIGENRVVIVLITVFWVCF